MELRRQLITKAKLWVFRASAIRPSVATQPSMQWFGITEYRLTSAIWELNCGSHLWLSISVVTSLVSVRQALTILTATSFEHFSGTTKTASNKSIRFRSLITCSVRLPDSTRAARLLAVRALLKALVLVFSGRTA